MVQKRPKTFKKPKILIRAKNSQRPKIIYETGYPFPSTKFSVLNFAQVIIYDYLTFEKTKNTEKTQMTKDPKDTNGKKTKNKGISKLPKRTDQNGVIPII